MRCVALRCVAFVRARLDLKENFIISKSHQNLIKISSTCFRNLIKMCLKFDQKFIKILMKFNQNLNAYKCAKFGVKNRALYMSTLVIKKSKKQKFWHRPQAKFSDFGSISGLCEVTREWRKLKLCGGHFYNSKMASCYVQMIKFQIEKTLQIRLMI